MAQKPTVTSVLKFKTPAEQQARFKTLGARFVKIDPDTGLQLYKTSAGLVLRPRDVHTVEVLANCVC